VVNPPIKLLDFFISKYDNDQPRRSLQYVNEAARGHSPSLQNACAVDAVLASKIIRDLKRRWGAAARDRQPTAVFLCGPCGSGKSTLAEKLSSKLAVSYIEGDEMHSIAARQSMRSGAPLTDNDRTSWLSHIRGAVVDRLILRRESTVIITCSALKQSNRDCLRELQSIAGIRTVFVMLATDSREELKSRLDSRQGHYMGASMVDVQVDTLQGCREDEADVIPVDAAQSLEDVFGETKALLAPELR
jgi:carbohydrate kinase (thermoresistant glucokinase family)